MAVVDGALGREADADPDLVLGAIVLVPAGEVHVQDGQVDVLEHGLLGPGPAQRELVRAVGAEECGGREVRALGQRDGVVQAHLGRLARLGGGAPRVAAD